ncbi:hypothetical protein JL722_11956 [Aureococcus anophagefferens]|nr:hypothetical protein JL722_11956 [Aureococcus anophagefferens]
MSLRPFLRLRRIGSRPPAWACALHTDEFEASRRPPAPAARPAPFPLLLAQSAAVAGRPPAFASDAFLRHRARRRFSSSPKPAEDVEPPAYHGAAPRRAPPRRARAGAQARRGARAGAGARRGARGLRRQGAVPRAPLRGDDEAVLARVEAAVARREDGVGAARALVQGYDLTRRERKQLLRTTADLIRVVPFAVFVLVPFLEFLLPVALAVFPGMLPSTFQDSTKKEEKAKATLRARLALAGFLGDALGEMRQRSADGDGSATATELTAFVAKARTGDIGTADVTKFARTFGDELMLDNLPRAQLVNLCRYMAIAPYGTDVILRFQLRSKIRGLREDDRRIVYEGLDSLTRQELQEACADRACGPPSPSRRRPRSSSRRRPSESISASTSLVDEAVAAVASKEEAKSSEVKAKKLKVLKQQNYLIEEERREAAALEVERKEAAAALEKAREEPEQPEPAEKLSSDAPDAHLGSDVERAFRSEAEPYAASLFGDGPGAEAYGRLAEDEAPPTKDDASEFTAKDKMEIGEVLVDMAYESALEREKEELEEAALAPTAKDDAAAAADEKVASSPDGGDEPAAAPAPEAEPDKKVAALEKKLASMTEKIEQEIAKVDVKLGDKLHHIDKDNRPRRRGRAREAIRAIAVRQGKFADDDKAMEKFIVVALSEIDLDNDGAITATRSSAVRRTAASSIRSRARG